MGTSRNQPTTPPAIWFASHKPPILRQLWEVSPRKKWWWVGAIATAFFFYSFEKWRYAEKQKVAPGPPSGQAVNDPFLATCLFFRRGKLVSKEASFSRRKKHLVNDVNVLFSKTNFFVGNCNQQFSRGLLFLCVFDLQGMSMVVFSLLC